MGYRPMIKCRDVKFELGKFYGYVELENLKSIEWLFNHGKIEEIHDVSYYPEIHFTADEFREFMDLYQQDINQFDFESDGCFIKYDKPFRISDWYAEYPQIYDNDDDKIIEWG